MKKTLYLLLFAFIFLGCNNKISSIKGTTWVLSVKEGTNTLVFLDSTYIAKISHGEVYEQKEFPYTTISDTIYLPAFGSTVFKGVIKGDELILYQNELIELPDTSFNSTHEIIYKKRK